MLSKKLTLAGLKVFVVDDHAQAYKLIQLALASYYAELIGSSTAAAALEQLQVHSPDILISDVDMPDIEGYELVRAVRNLPPQKGKHTPAIALSGCNQTEDLARAANVGFQKHLSKSFEFQVLITTVMGLVNKPLAQI